MVAHWQVDASMRNQSVDGGGHEGRHHRASICLDSRELQKTPGGFRFWVDEGMAFSFGASSSMTNSVRKEIWPRSNEKEGVDRRKKMPMVAHEGGRETLE